MTSVHDPRSDEPRASDIPADIRSLASDYAERLKPDDFEWNWLLFCKAIAGERERCVKAAERGVFDEHALAQATDYGRGCHAAAFEIAAAIGKPLGNGTFSGTLRYDADKADGLLSADGREC